jgi:DHA1 family bicyclomycin/chloramphenicol resistance-like MFS transporter
MAASLQGFVSGMVNVMTAGVISPAISHDPRLLAVGMFVLMSIGFLSWRLYLRSARRKAAEPLRPLPSL